MTNPEITAAKSKSYTLIWAIISTAITAIIVYKEGKSLFNWTKFNPNVIDDLFVLLFSLICINWWLQFFDNRPVLKLNSEGIFDRTEILLFSKTQQIPWTRVNHFYISTETRKSTTEYLVIGLKEIEKEKKIELTSLDKSVADILTFVEDYSVKYNFQDLGQQTKL